jgi:hypothetical protein
MPLFSRWTEAVGRVTGAALAPLTALVSRIRHARMFHPDGAIYRGHASPAAGTPWPELAARLSGPLLTRWSSAWWRGEREWPDVLGMALRFRSRTTASPEADDGDQDLLLATIRHPWTMPLAPLTTRVHDFLANDYYGVSPFAIKGLGNGWLRAVSIQTGPAADTRRDRLARAVESGTAHWRLEVRPEGEETWHPLLELRLTSPVTIDQRRLRFSAFRDGRGLRPIGFVHALRAATYPSSQASRPLSAAHP